MDDVCEPCREYQAGERRDQMFSGVRVHVCEMIPPQWFGTFPCPCGCDETQGAPEPGKRPD